MTPIRTLLICHHDAPLHADGFARWLASWSKLVGIVIVQEPGGLFLRRVRRETRRVGWLRMLDVLAFRLWQRLRLASGDAVWINARLAALRAQYPAAEAPICRASSPNAATSEAFMRQTHPDIVIALCKNILAERVFSVPRAGTVVLHPGVCPEYRNAHGCFWALANDDLGNVGMTLLRIDSGVDTGPVLAYFRATYDERRESHIVIQHRMLFDNLDAIAKALTSLVSHGAAPISTTGRASREWGQPWLTAYWRWQRAANRRVRALRGP